MSTQHLPDQVQASPRPESFTDLFRTMTANIEHVIQGKRDVVQLVLLAMLAEGHVLLEDAPGVGKTTIGKALAATVDLPFGRVQFTPDLLPSDVLGVSVWNQGSQTFEFRAGPIFNGVVLADEVNRASPKTQSALLEAMAERQVTSDGVSRELNRPFMVIATQNPLEHAGTYPLPESQLDRFLVKISVGYPTRDAELAILDTHGTSDPFENLSSVVDAPRVGSMIDAAKSVHVSPALRSYVIDIADATRNHPSLSLGMSPRASLALQNIARARAAAAGRNYATPDDVKALAPHVITHRLVLSPDAEMRGSDPRSLVHDILSSIPAGAG